MTYFPCRGTRTMPLRLQPTQFISAAILATAIVWPTRATRAAAPKAPSWRAGVARVNHVSFSMPGFDVARIQGALERQGITPRPQGASGALQHWVSMRMPNRGGAEGGTPELYFSDPDGLSIQLQDISYCGGGGYLGDICTQPARPQA